MDKVQGGCIETNGEKIDRRKARENGRIVANIPRDFRIGNFLFVVSIIFENVMDMLKFLKGANHRSSIRFFLTIFQLLLSKTNTQSYLKHSEQLLILTSLIRVRMYYMKKQTVK